MRFLTEQHQAVAVAKDRRERARIAIGNAGSQDELDAAEAELLASAKAVREARAMPEQFECVHCGPLDEPSDYVIYHIDHVTRHTAEGTFHEDVNLHRLECAACNSASAEYHEKR